MPQVGSEPTIPVFMRAKTAHALDAFDRLTSRVHCDHCDRPLLLLMTAYSVI
jgi:hypothetical protein